MSQQDKTLLVWSQMDSRNQLDTTHSLLEWHSRFQLGKSGLRMNLLDNRSQKYMKLGQMKKYISYQQDIMSKKFQTPPYHQNIYMLH